MVAGHYGVHGAPVREHAVMVPTPVIKHVTILFLKMVVQLVVVPQQKVVSVIQIHPVLVSTVITIVLGNGCY